MHGYAIRTRLLSQPGHGGGIRLDKAPVRIRFVPVTGLPNGGYVIDALTPSKIIGTDYLRRFLCETQLALRVFFLCLFGHRKKVSEKARTVKASRSTFLQGLQVIGRTVALVG